MPTHGEHPLLHVLSLVLIVLDSYQKTIIRLADDLVDMLNADG